jgi:hypothetical protein
MQRFRAMIEPVKGGGHYVVVPEKTAEKAGLTYRARVRGKVAGAAFRSSLMKYSGIFHMGVHKATLAAAGVEAGDTVVIELELDTEPLPTDTVPPDVTRALRTASAAARAAWEKLSPSHRREWVKHVTEAKREATRAARVEKLIAALRDGRRSASAP